MKEFDYKKECIMILKNSINQIEKYKKTRKPEYLPRLEDEEFFCKELLNYVNSLINKENINFDYFKEALLYYIKHKIKVCDFMLDNYEEICELVSNFKENKERLQNACYIYEQMEDFVNNRLTNLFLGEKNIYHYIVGIYIQGINSLLDEDDYEDIFESFSGKKYWHLIGQLDRGEINYTQIKIMNRIRLKLGIKGDKK